MANNDDVILRGRALKDLRGIKDVLMAQGDPFLANIMNRAIECIENQPAAQIAPARTGRNLAEDTPSRFECSVCGWTDWDTYTGDSDEYNYCPGCGAKMEEGKGNAGG